MANALDGTTQLQEDKLSDIGEHVHHNKRNINVKIIVELIESLLIARLKYRKLCILTLEASDLTVQNGVSKHINS